MKYINKILNHVSNRNYHKLNKRIDDVLVPAQRRLFDLFQQYEKRADEKLAQKLVSTSYMDFKNVLVASDRVSFLEGYVKILEERIKKLEK